MHNHINKKITIDYLRKKFAALCADQTQYETKSLTLNLNNWYKISTIKSIFISREYEIKMIDKNLKDFFKLEYQNFNKVIPHLNVICTFCEAYKQKHPKRRKEAIYWLSQHFLDKTKSMKARKNRKNIEDFFEPSTKQLKNNRHYTKYHIPEYPQECANETIKLFNKLKQTNITAINNQYFDNILTYLSKWRSKQRKDHGFYARRVDKIPNGPTQYKTSLVPPGKTSEDPDGIYPEIYKMTIDAINEIGNTKETINFGPLTLKMETETKADSRMEGWFTKIKYIINGNSKTEFITLSCIVIYDEEKINRNFEESTLYHPLVNDIEKQLIPSLGLLFKLCCSPARNKINKLRQLATFEWIMQQTSPFRRSTPTITKVIVCALLLLNDFRPIYNGGNNDMNCFASFTHNLTKYWQIWVKNNPFIPNNVTLQL